MPRLNLIERPQPFIGVLLAGAGWALSNQVGSDGAFDGCATGDTLTIIASLIGLLITGAGGFYCLLSWRKDAEGGRGFLATLGMLLALISAFAIVLQIAAGIILPPCAA